MEGEGENESDGVNAFAGTSSPPPFRKSHQNPRRLIPRSPDHGRRHSVLMSESAEAGPREPSATHPYLQPHLFPHPHEEQHPDEDRGEQEPGPGDDTDAASVVADTDDGQSEANGPTGPRKETVGRGVPVARPEGEVSLVVGGRRFVCQAALFQQHPNTMLGRMFGSSLDAKLSRPNDNGDYVITHSVTSAAFQPILNFYKSGQMRCPPNVSVAELHEACSFFMIPFTHTNVKCENLGHLLQQLSNQGARSQFEEFIEESILPAMARCAQVRGYLSELTQAL